MRGVAGSRVLLVVGMTVAALMAGCASGAPKDDGPALGPDVVVDAGSGLGAIAGVVVDEAIRPIVGATVAIVGGGNTTTDEAGGFVFADLEPGTYFLAGNATRHDSVQTSVEVVAGEVARARLLLTRLLTADPYHVTYHHQGFIQFSPAAAGPLINIIVDEFADNPLCTCTLAFNTTGHDVKTIVVEGIWQDTLAPPTGPSTLYLEVFPAELDDGTSDIQGGFLPSPILQHYPIAMWGENETNSDWRARLTGDGFSAQFNQPYDLFVTVFAVAEAPDGWSLVAGDT